VIKVEQEDTYFTACKNQMSWVGGINWVTQLKKASTLVTGNQLNCSTSLALKHQISKGPGHLGIRTFGDQKWKQNGGGGDLYGMTFNNQVPNITFVPQS